MPAPASSSSNNSNKVGRPRAASACGVQLLVLQYINGARAGSFLLDVSRGSVEAILRSAGGGELRPPRYAVDWRDHAREPRAGTDFSALAWQITTPVTGVVCTRCAGGSGTFMACTMGPNGEACGSCRWRRHAPDCAPFAPALEARAAARAARAAAIAVESSSSEEEEEEWASAQSSPAPPSRRRRLSTGCRFVGVVIPQRGPNGGNQ
ncbi:hypothetical protein KEM52_002939 [Ascosphaera acerosa]|nr:hypothetical protein KEM52_002939 [Ascosphaera acerosa]